MAIQGSELMKSYRFGLIVNGSGPYPVTRIRGLQVDVAEGGDIDFAPVTIEAGVYKGKDPKDMLLWAFAAKNMLSLTEGIKIKDFDVSIEGYADERQSMDGTPSYIVSCTNCSLCSYEVGPWDACENKVVKETVVLSICDMVITVPDYI